MRRPLAMIMTVALMLAFSLPGSVQSARAQDPGSCVNVSVTTNVTVVVTVDVTVNVTIGNDGSVGLVWQPDTEPDTAGWNVYRSDGPDGPYVKMNDTPIPNDSLCHYTDRPGNGQDRNYLIESMDSDGHKKPRANVGVR